MVVCFSHLHSFMSLVCWLNPAQHLHWSRLLLVLFIGRLFVVKTSCCTVLHTLRVGIITLSHSNSTQQLFFFCKVNN